VNWLLVFLGIAIVLLVIGLVLITIGLTKSVPRPAACPLRCYAPPPEMSRLAEAGLAITGFGCATVILATVGVVLP